MRKKNSMYIRALVLLGIIFCHTFNLKGEGVFRLRNLLTSCVTNVSHSLWSANPTLKLMVNGSIVVLTVIAMKRKRDP